MHQSSRPGIPCRRPVLPARLRASLSNPLAVHQRQRAPYPKRSIRGLGRPSNGSEADVLCNHREYGFYCSHRLDCGQAHDPPARRNPPFATASGAPGRADDCAIDTPQLFINGVGIPQTIQDPPERSVLIPFVEKVPGRSPRTKLLRQIPPWGTGVENP